jgi:hypothetical protein
VNAWEYGSVGVRCWFWLDFCTDAFSVFRGSKKVCIQNQICAGGVTSVAGVVSSPGEVVLFLNVDAVCLCMWIARKMVNINLCRGKKG